MPQPQAAKKLEKRARSPQNPKYPMRSLTFFIAFLLAAPLLSAQDDDTEYRMELGAGVGLAFGLNDCNSAWYGSSNIGGALVGRFVLNPRMAIKVNLGYGRLGGTTEGRSDFYPANPNASGPAKLNYQLSGDLYDLSALYELHFLPYGYTRGYQGYRRLTPYLQMGFGFSYGTAGKAFTCNIPLGVGVKFKASRRLNLGLEWRMHLTPSDKLDGLEQPLGIKSMGFRNKDHYSFTLFTLTYDLAPRCPTCNRD